MKFLIYRVGADYTGLGGGMHGQLNEDRTFTYLPIPEKYDSVYTPKYKEHPMKDEIPESMLDKHIHLDPDFKQGTYGNIYIFRNGNKNPKGQKLLQFEENTPVRLVFFSALKDQKENLRYGFIGQLIARKIKKIDELGDKKKMRNVHGQRKNGEGDGRSVIAIADKKDPRSGRFSKFIEFASYRDNYYRVIPELIEKWGGWSSENGACQQGGPWMPGDHDKFKKWLDKELEDRSIQILKSNW